MKQKAFGVETRQHSQSLFALYNSALYNLFGIYISPARREYPGKWEMWYEEKSPFSPYLFS